MDLKCGIVWSAIYSGLHMEEVAQTFLVSEKLAKKAVEWYLQEVT